MCDEAVTKNPWMLEYVPDHFKNQATCDKVFREDPWFLKYIPDRFITEEMCEIDVTKFCKKDMIDITREYHAILIKKYKKRKALKQDIKDDLLPMA